MRYTLFLLILLCANHTLIAQRSTRPAEKMTVSMCLEKSQEAKKKGDYRGASEFLNKAAFIHWEKKELQEAIKHYQTSLVYNRKVGNQSGIYGICSNLATIYADLRKYDSSLVFFKKTLIGRKQQGVSEPIISAHINIAVVLNNLKRHQEASKHLIEALELAKQSLDLNQMRSCYGMLAETYEKMGDAKQTQYYFNLYKDTHEMFQKQRMSKVNAKAKEASLKAKQASLQAKLAETQKKKAELEVALKNTEIIQQARKIKAKDSTITQLGANYSKKDLAYKILEQRKEIQKAVFAKKHAQDRQKIANQRLYAGAITSIFLLALVGIFLSYLNQKSRKRANIELQAKNEKINEQKLRIVEQNYKLESTLDSLASKNAQVTASIRYAKRIQEAILPNLYAIKQALPESFVYFKPLDIVSGDFYFFHKFRNTNKIVLAAVDCTGHGVPGALMCMIGNENLNRIVRSNHQDSPAKILSELSQGISIALQKDTTHIHDGMDMSLVVIDQKAKKLTYAGAKNPLVYIQNQEMHTMRGDRMAIGEINKLKVEGFKEHVVDLSITTTFYLFSDGYQDQFGGSRGRKLLIKNFRKLLLDIHQYPMEEQKQMLATHLENWKGTHPAIDDVLVIGARV